MLEAICPMQSYAKASHWRLSCAQGSPRGVRVASLGGPLSGRTADTGFGQCLSEFALSLANLGQSGPDFENESTNLSQIGANFD